MKHLALGILLLIIPSFSQEIDKGLNDIDLNQNILDSKNPSPTSNQVILSEPIFKHERNETLQQTHLILGWTTVGVSLLTGITARPLKGNQIHELMGYSAAGLAASTLVTGFLGHWDEIGTDGSSSNNIHTILGIVGGGLIAATPFLAPGHAHAEAGIIGTLLMGGAITWTYVF